MIWPAGSSARRGRSPGDRSPFTSAVGGGRQLETICSHSTLGRRRTAPTESRHRPSWGLNGGFASEPASPLRNTARPSPIGQSAAARGNGASPKLLQLDALRRHGLLLFGMIGPVLNLVR